MVKKRMGGKNGLEKFEEEKAENRVDAAVDVALLDAGFNMFEQQAKTQRHQDEFKSQHVQSLRDYNKPWEERTAIVAEWQSKGWGDTIPLDCPATFGPFQVSKWGGTGGCGFDIWFDENGSRQNRWIDLDPTYNLVKDVRDGWSQDPRGLQIASIAEKDRTPECLFTIFPGGYYISKESTELVKKPQDVSVAPVVEAQGGAYRKTRRNRKTKRKCKRANKKTNKRRCKKTKKHQKK